MSLHKILLSRSNVHGFCKIFFSRLPASRKWYVIALWIAKCDVCIDIIRQFIFIFPPRRIKKIYSIGNVHFFQLIPIEVYSIIFFVISWTRVNELQKKLDFFSSKKVQADMQLNIRLRRPTLFELMLFHYLISFDGLIERKKKYQRMRANEYKGKEKSSKYLTVHRQRILDANKVQFMVHRI